MGPICKIAVLFTILSGDTSTPSLPESEEFINKIIPNIWAFLVQLLALIVLIIVFIFVGYKPVKKIIQKREDHIEETIKAADENKKQSELLVSESEKTLKSAKLEADSIIKSANKEAEEISISRKEKTEEEIKEMKLKAEEDIKLAKEKAKDDIRHEIVDVALLASKELLQREVTNKDQEKFVDEFVKEVGKEDKK